MKLDPKFVAKIAGTLTIISLVVAALLGVVNSVTADKITAINAEKTAKAMSAVVPVTNAEFKPMDATEEMSAAATGASATLNAIYEVYDEGDMVGYTIEVVASGSQGDITMVVGVDTEGSVTGVSVVKSSETSGIGTKVVNNETGMLDSFVGMSLANGEITVNKGANRIDGVSGATVSSKGVVKGVNGALAVVGILG